MNGGHSTPFRRRTVALAATAAISLWPVFTSVPVSNAEPYGDDDGGSSYSDDGGTYGGGDEGTAPDNGGTYGGGDEGTAPDNGGTYGGGDEGTAPDNGGTYGGGDEGTEHGGGGEGSEHGGETGEGADYGGGGEGTEHGGGGEGTDHGGQPTDESGYGGEYVGEGVTQPTALEAPESDVAVAAQSKAVEISSREASSEEISSYLESIESTSTVFTASTAMTLNSPVSQWNSHWIRYDRNYRPVFVNPFADPLQVIYQYAGKPRGFTVAPRQKAALSARDPGVYSFTAFTSPQSGPVSNISVGSFSGGGYLPEPGQAPPQKPAPLRTVTKPIVQVKFAQGTSDPFRLRSLVDLGKDPAVDESTRVLLDGEIPAWGEWSKTRAGEAKFIITQTQPLPGLKPPGQDPLPGYKVQLSTKSRSASWFENSRTHVIGASVAAGVLAIAAVALFLIRRRRTEE